MTSLTRKNKHVPAPHIPISALWLRLYAQPTEAPAVDTIKHDDCPPGAAAPEPTPFVRPIGPMVTFKVVDDD